MPTPPRRSLAGWALLGALAAGLPPQAAAASERRALQTSDIQCEAPNIGAAERLTSYFDIASLTCEACAGTRLRSADGLYCECNRDNPCTAAETTAGTCPETTARPPGCCPCVASVPTETKYASQDATVLMTCQANADPQPGGLYYAATNPSATATGDALDCGCAGNQRLLEFDQLGQRLRGAGGLEKRCMACPHFSYASTTNRYECVACPGPGDDGDHTSECGCAACADTTPEGGTANCINEMADVSLGDCVDSAWLDASINAEVRSSYANMEYVGVSNGESDDAAVSVVSHLYKETFWPSAANCFRVVKGFAQGQGPVQLERTQACQALANLCVLQDYSDSNGAVCKLFEEGGKLDTMIGQEVNGEDYVNGEPRWLKHLPWLYRDVSIRVDTDRIKLKVGFGKYSSNPRHHNLIAHQSSETDCLRVQTRSRTKASCGRCRSSSPRTLLTGRGWASRTSPPSWMCARTCLGAPRVTSRTTSMSGTASIRSALSTSRRSSLQVRLLVRLCCLLCI